MALESSIHGTRTMDLAAVAGAPLRLSQDYSVDATGKTPQPREWFRFRVYSRDVFGQISPLGAPGRLAHVIETVIGAPAEDLPRFKNGSGGLLTRPLVGLPGGISPRLVCASDNRAHFSPK